MTLRARLAVLTSVAVTLAVLAASVAAWLLIRSTLMDEVDQELLSRGSQADRIVQAMDRSTAMEETRFYILVQGQPIGVQEIGPDGRIVGTMPPGDVVFSLDREEQQLLAGALEDPQLRTETIDGTPYRVMTAPVSGGGAVRLIQPLDNVEQTMTRMAWLLVGVAGAGVAVAGGLGWLIARAGLRPVNRLARAAELVASTKDLAYRVAAAGHRRDEIARLAGSINGMLAALDSARTQQRQLVENAGHELRTPLATLRNDLGVLRCAAPRTTPTVPSPPPTGPACWTTWRPRPQHCLIWSESWSTSRGAGPSRSRSWRPTCGHSSTAPSPVPAGSTRG